MRQIEINHSLSSWSYYGLSDTLARLSPLARLSRYQTQFAQR
jgi:hypothetical protein